MRNLYLFICCFLLTPLLAAEPTQKVVLKTLEGQSYFEVDIPASFSGGIQERPRGTAYANSSFYIWLDKANKKRLQVVLSPSESALTPDSVKRTLAFLQSETPGATPLRLPKLTGAQYWRASYGGYQNFCADVRGDYRQATFQLCFQDDGRGKSRSSLLQEQLNRMLQSLRVL
ncbi:hypothetical protein ABS71_15100 [bacterium SCN 62-11]|nr:MAG: hypothetical protein ABS71_15100 [bacterium SCN 62-11]